MQPGALGWYRPVPPRRAVTTATDLAPVIWPRPGTVIPMRGQPSGVTAQASTGTLPRIKLTGEDTGEIRRIGDAMVAAIEQGRL
jgi:hypothetical protein